MDYAFWWSQEPFFSTPDHIWLPGQFYIFGALFWIIPDLEVISTAFSIMGTLLVCLGCTNLAALLVPNKIAAVFAGLLASVNWMVLWASTSAMAEVFFYPSLLLTANAWVAAFALSSDLDENKRINLQDQFLFCAAIANGFGNMFRYESWYFGIPLGCFFLVRLAMRCGKGEFTPVSRIVYPFASAFVIALYPVAHAISSWVGLGSPLAFFTTHTEMNAQTNLFYGEQTLFEKLWNYPLILWEDHWYLLPLSLLGIVLSLGKSERRSSVFYHAGVWLVFVFAMLISVKSGIGSNTRPRFTTFFVLLMGVFSAYPLALIFRTAVGWWRVPVAILGLLLLLLHGNASLFKGIQQYPNAYAVHSNDAALIMRLKLESGIDRQWKYPPMIHPQDWDLCVFAQGDGVTMWPFRYHSWQPERVYFLWSEESLYTLARERVPNRSFVLRKPFPGDLNLEEHYNLSLEMPDWQVWHSKQ
ncbi:MAG: hypothetical protein SFY68_13905 [Candidatus Sumerlaeia bacterium]|nr:hypothetical protein [Candidatus Sumerlaeia bacterium]